MLLLRSRVDRKLRSLLPMPSHRLYSQREVNFVHVLLGLLHHTPLLRFCQNMLGGQDCFTYQRC